MGGPTVSPGGALLRSSRLFSIPRPLPEPPSATMAIGHHKSPTMTRQYPQHQSITTPQSSREKGDWGLKRPFPLRSTLTTSTPLIRVKQVDSIESITDFASAADHTLSLEKFKELRVALSIPKDKSQYAGPSRATMWPKSVFEEEMDFTETRSGKEDGKRWKFQGPWLARLGEGDFLDYLKKQVRPRRAEFREVLRQKLAENMTTAQSTAAVDKGEEPPAAITPQDITEEQFIDYLRALRNDRATLYELVSKFLDLAPLGQPVGIVQSFLSAGSNAAIDSPYGKAGPPPSHPSAGISYLRTSSFMENHPIYGPQGRRSPVLSRVIMPRANTSPAKLGVGGFVADVPLGDNEFNARASRARHTSGRKMLMGIASLDTTTFGGAKAYVDPSTATIDPSGKVVLQLREASEESQVIAKENQGRAQVYNEDKRPGRKTKVAQQNQGAKPDPWRLDNVADEILKE